MTWFMTSISGSRPTAMVLPTNPDAGVAWTIPAYVAALTTTAVNMPTVISVRCISSLLLL
jgi:hypothetical protein